MSTEQPPYHDPSFEAQGYGVPPALPPLAHWGLRVGAYLVDLLLLVPGYVVVVIGGVLGSGSDGSALGPVLMAVGYLAIVGTMIWNLFVRQGSTGWSVGKQAVGIRLLKEETMQPMGGGLAFVRYLAHILDGLPCYLGYLWPLWDNKRQTFADKIMSTVVVVQKKPA